MESGLIQKKTQKSMDIINRLEAVKAENAALLKEAGKLQKRFVKAENRLRSLEAKAGYVCSQKE